MVPDMVTRWVMMKGKRRDAHRLLRQTFLVGDECWEWKGHKLRGGYGVYGNPPGVLAHRAVYTVLVGPIPDGMTLDHLCRNRACVRPDHLEPVSMRENIMRSPVAPAAVHAKKTRCKWGHEFTPENTRVRQTSCGVARECRECARVSHRRAYARRKGRLL